MKEIMVAYWSGTGNTAAMAAILGKGIQDGGATAKVVSVEDIKADDLKDYPVFALGCPSMGNETLEETVMEDFVTEVESFASGKKIGLFGSYGWGDGEWMRNWVARMEEAGAQVYGGEDAICMNEPDSEAEEKLEALGKEAVLHGEMCLGEGSGAVALFPFLDMGVAVYESMSTFEDIHVDQYEELV